jgi:hypothetical protein
MKKNNRKQNQFYKTIIALLGAVTILLFLIFSYNHLTIPILLTLLLSIIGIFLCASIFQHQLGKENMITRELCRNNNQISCNKVLANGQLVRSITLTDVGLIYFIFQCLSLLMAIANNMVPYALALFLIFGYLAFIFSIVLIGYQWLIIKSWCNMCLVITGIVCLQALTLSLNHFYDDITFNKSFLYPVISSFVICFLLAILWLIIKPFIIKANDNKKIADQLLRWKRNPILFITLLKQQRKINNELWEDEFVLGNPKAPIQLIVVLNPYCKACEKEHEEIKKIVLSLPEDIYAVIRFTADTIDLESKHTIAINQILSAYLSAKDTPTRMKVLEDWFASKNVESFKKIQKTSNAYEINTKLIFRHEQWYKQNDIMFTPSIFINGFHFPDPYKVTDLKYLIKRQKYILREQKRCRIFSNHRIREL